MGTKIKKSYQKNKGFQRITAETPNFTGTDGETRTLKEIHPGDFESPASTNSATSARID
jgi:hypothetical protein